RGDDAATGQVPPRIGRFIVKRVVGAGAMGLVVEAHDPQLDRVVALKLRRGLDHPDDERRLLEEARAMARLANPNIVAIHEVGREGDTDFLVIEFVEGVTLRAHLQRGDLPVDERLALLVQAGRGLAAAHRAQVVHRDFKPENVLVDASGRARVTDFGLAALAPRSGLAGTPAYLAPELLAGARATTASDQYAFCVTAFEALTGARPARGGPVAWPPGSRVAPRVRAAITRGLSPRPEDRFASMEKLLDELTPRARFTAGRLALATAATTALLVAALGWAWSTRARCEGEASLVSVLTPAERAFVRSLGVDEDAALSRWSSAWLAQYRESCEATVVRHEASAARLDARMGCLERQRRSAGALLTLVHERPETVARLVGALPDPQTCSAAAPAGVWPRAEPERHERSARELAVVEMLVDSGFFVEARGRLARLRQESDEGSEFHAWAGFFEALMARDTGARADAEKKFVWVYAQASRAGDDELALRAALGRARTLGTFDGRLDEALTQLELARGLVDRIPSANRTAAAYFRAWGEVLLYAERYDEAQRQLLEALERAGPTSPLRRFLEYDLTEACFARGQWACAVEHARRALRHAEDSFPANAPALAQFVAALALAELNLGQHPEESAALLERLDRLIGPVPFEESPGLWAVSWSARALEAQTRGDFAGAVPLARRAADAYLVLQPSRSGRTLLELAWAEVLAGELEAAEADVARSRGAPDAERTKGWGATVRLVAARVRGDLAAQERAAGEVDLAKMVLPERLFARLELGELDLQRGRRAAAGAHCEALRGELAAAPMRPQLEAPVFFFCARALAEPAEVEALLERARGSYERGEQPAFETRRFERFLDARGR
ncbi:MAG: protein kinase domain-containing protein, partial [Myxococcota bacterium]